MIVLDSCYGVMGGCEAVSRAAIGNLMARGGLIKKVHTSGLSNRLSDLCASAG